ncbi:MAG: L,D-transpeptidase family protein [Mucilaginibacter sp.]|jgi:murein L,D-transpeptidase YcbB/YkuD|uniref:L,D-transpeptidase family protein n=1 Tax=Mucilaginibacter sp. TaxID=1882438 RepID=UPI0035631D70
MRPTFIIVFILSFCLLCACYGCHSSPAKKQVKASVSHADTLIKGNFNAAPQLKFDSVAIADFLKKHPSLNGFAAEYAKFYRINKYHYVWYDSKGLTESAGNLINHVTIQQNDGILKDIPYKEDFLKMTESFQSDKTTPPSIAVELMLTGQYFNYAKNAWGGAEAEKAKDIGWYLPRKKLSYTDLLAHNLKSDAASIEQVAVIPQYMMLKKALNHYQQVEKTEPDILLPSKGPLSMLSPGDTSALLVQLKNRLRQLGDSTVNFSNVYDTLLINAVMHFKDRHGLKPDGKINSPFLKQLNVPLHQRINQIIVNLERMRWIPADDHGGEFLLVNIPEFKLHYYINNSPEWACSVVVGKSMTKTVIFSGHLQYIVFSPYWYIPPSIIQKEIKPGIARNPNYLANHHMEWNGGNVRQLPGKENSLGLVKFIFPNSNNIYLHDTPSKSLFNEDVRAFSHGCIRVEKPEELAELLLKQNPAWTPQKIRAAMNRGVEQSVVLKQKIPVYIGYFTAFVDHNGALNFRDDIYQRDEPLLKMLMKP